MCGHASDVADPLVTQLLQHAGVKVRPSAWGSQWLMSSSVIQKTDTQNVALRENQKTLFLSPSVSVKCQSDSAVMNRFTQLHGTWPFTLIWHQLPGHWSLVKGFWGKTKKNLLEKSTQQNDQYEVLSITEMRLNYQCIWGVIAIYGISLPYLHNML